MRRGFERSPGALLPVLLLALAACGPSAAKEADSGLTGPVALARLEGGSEDLLRPDEQRVEVYLVALSDCPVALALAPEFGRIAASFNDEDSVFRVLLVDREGAATRAEPWRSGDAAVYLDPDQALSARLGATMTPQAVVVATREGRRRVVYSGRINDLYVDFGQRRAKPSRHDLRDAVAQAVRGGRVEPTTSPVIGCPVPELEKR